MIEATTSLLMLVSAFYGTPDTTASVANAMQATVAKTAIVEVQKETNIPHDQPQTMEQYVRMYYKDTPLLAEIARCESTFRHLDKDGTPLRGGVNKGDIGVMQINETYHLESAVNLGYDIHTTEGNVAYARYLYNKYGSSPWNASKPCWGNRVVAMK